MVLKLRNNHPVFPFLSFHSIKSSSYNCFSIPLAFSTHHSSLTVAEMYVRQFLLPVNTNWVAWLGDVGLSLHYLVQHLNSPPSFQVNAAWPGSLVHQINFAYALFSQQSHLYAGQLLKSKKHRILSHSKLRLTGNSLTTVLELGAWS